MIPRMTRDEYLAAIASRIRGAELDPPSTCYRTPRGKDGACFEFGVASGEISAFGMGVMPVTVLAYAVKVTAEGGKELYAPCPGHLFANLARKNLMRLKSDALRRLGKVPLAA